MILLILLKLLIITLLLSLVTPNKTITSTGCNGAITSTIITNTIATNKLFLLLILQVQLLPLQPPLLLLLSLLFSYSFMTSSESCLLLSVHSYIYTLPSIIRSNLRKLYFLYNWYRVYHFGRACIIAFSCSSYIFPRHNHFISLLFWLLPVSLHHFLSYTYKTHTLCT